MQIREHAMKKFMMRGCAVAWLSLGAVSLAFSQSTSMTEGEIRKVDRDAQKLTIKHGPITNLDMPGMTMVFRVSDPAMLDKVKAGDKIRFAVEKVQGAYTVMKVEPAK
jgi:Cu(I)/Ag(I) efflux system periplasmic protein CusF